MRSAALEGAACPAFGPVATTTVQIALGGATGMLSEAWCIPGCGTDDWRQGGDGAGLWMGSPGPASEKPEVPLALACTSPSNLVGTLAGSAATRSTEECCSRALEESGGLKEVIPSGKLFSLLQLGQERLVDEVGVVGGAITGDECRSGLSRQAETVALGPAGAIGCGAEVKA